MPLRTNRRAVLYRRLWGWPLRSPQHAAAAVAAAAAAAVALGMAVSTGAPGPPRPQPRLPAPPARAHPAPAGPAVPGEALAAAAEFGQRWTTHNLDGPAFVQNLRPVAAPEYLIALSAVDPARIPDTTVTGPPRPVGSDGPGTATVDLPTNAQVLHLALVATPQGWRLDHLNGGGR